MLSRRRLVLISLAAVAGPSAAFAEGGALIHLHHPWIRATPGGATTAAGYITIHNGGSGPDRLLSATADFASAAMIHKTVVTNGVASMEMVDGIDIPKAQMINLQPKQAYHIMFTGLKKPLVNGDRVTGTLVFAKAGTVAVEWEVQAVAAVAPAKPDDGMMTMPDGTKMKM